MDPVPTQPSAPVQPVATPPVVPPNKSKLPWILLVVVLLLAMGAGGIFLGQRLVKPDTTPTPTPVAVVPTSAADSAANLLTYTNTKYNFSFKYPSNLVPPDPKGYEHIGYQSSVDYQNSLGKTVNDRLFEFNIDSFPKETYSDVAKLTFEELIGKEVRTYCTAEGVGGGFQCDKMTVKDRFLTDSGVEGLKFEYSVTVSDLKNRTTTSRTTGMMYAFNLSDDKNSRIILFHAPSFVAPSGDDQNLLESILLTFKMIR